MATVNARKRPVTTCSSHPPSPFPTDEVSITAIAASGTASSESAAPERTEDTTRTTVSRRPVTTIAHQVPAVHTGTTVVPALNTSRSTIASRTRPTRRSSRRTEAAMSSASKEVSNRRPP